MDFTRSDLLITGIILASGFSKRMGKDKLLIRLNGEYIIERVIKTALASDLDKVLLVYRKEEIKEIGKKHGIKTILNESAHLGQSQSLKLGVDSIKEESDYMFLMGDQPFLKADTINFLIEEYKASSKGILVPYYDSNKSMPTIFGYRYKGELMNQEGDRGGREIIEKNKEDIIEVHLKDKKLGVDVDTIKDLERVKKWT